MSSNLPKLPEIRKPLYESGDKHREMLTVAHAAHNVELVLMIEAVRIAHDNLRDYLDANYIWD